MINRFTGRNIVKTSPKNYNYSYFEERDKKYIYHYDTPKFTYPTEDQLSNIVFLEHVWSYGDRLYKLSRRFYGDERDWWVILRFNKIGSEVSIKLGDVIKIPVPLEDIVGLFLQG